MLTAISFDRVGISVMTSFSVQTRASCWQTQPPGHDDEGDDDEVDDDEGDDDEDSTT